MTSDLLESRDAVPFCTCVCVLYQCVCVFQELWHSSPPAHGYRCRSDIITSPAPNTLTSRVIPPSLYSHSRQSCSRRARADDVCLSLPAPAAVAPAFGNVSSSVSEDGARISWEYWGPEKHLYVEYIIDNSKSLHASVVLLMMKHI